MILMLTILIFGLGMVLVCIQDKQMGMINWLALILFEFGLQGLLELLFRKIK